MTNQTASQLLIALKTSALKYRARLNTCRQQCNETAVHDLRTATRRLLAVIDLFRELTPDRRLDKLRQILKSQLDQFDELRDTQVMLLEIETGLQTLPELTAFQLHLQQREQQLLLETDKFIKTIRQARLKRKLKKAHSRCKNLSRKQDSLNTAMLTMIDKVYATALNRYADIDPLNLASIHYFRISMKKLRYILDAAQTLLPGYPKAQNTRLQNYLTLMGDIQNSAVLFDALARFFDNAIPENSVQYFRQQQHQMLKHFMLKKAEVLEFWRKSSTNSWPWEIKL